ncbi:aurK [Symbiodinium sp. CCMP2592]|nr:aurK [Symbiodinium sp. CCMP2592]
MLRSSRVLNEEKLRSMARQLMLGLKVVHKLGFIHRDIKPANLLCAADGLLRIADFGWCCHKEDSPTCLAGTLLYMAPEVLSNVPQTVKADVWSAGMTLFQMIAGRTLLQTNLDPGMTKLSERDPVKSTLLRQQWLLREIDAVCPPSDKLRPNHVSPSAWDLVQKMLKTDPAERISVDEALSHPWLRELTEVSDDELSETSPSDLILRSVLKEAETPEKSRPRNEDEEEVDSDGGHPPLSPARNPGMALAAAVDESPRLEDDKDQIKEQLLEERKENALLKRRLAAYEAKALSCLGWCR